MNNEVLDDVINNEDIDIETIFKDMDASLKIGKFVFKCKLERDCFLPKFKGSTFRGVFGRALRKISCGVEDKECNTCLIKDNCLYAKVFEQDLEELKEKNIFASSHPYIIDCEDNVRTRYQKGDYFVFNLILLGDYIYKIPYFIYAIIEMGKIGFGKKDKNGDRAKFSVAQVLMNNNQVYSDISNQIDNQVVKDEVLFINKDYLESFFKYNNSTVKVILKSPLRFKLNNSFENTLNFETLIKIIIRRINILFNMYGDKQIQINSELLKNEATKVKVLDDNLYWQDTRRYSLRQEHSMFLGGLLGEISYSGNLKIFMPLLKVAEDLHLGKQTSFGLGKIEIIS